LLWPSGGCEIVALPLTPTTDLPDSFTSTLERFLRVMYGRDTAELTIEAYRTDLRQCFTRQMENNTTATSPERIERADDEEFPAYRADRGSTGLTRARKLAALRALSAFSWPRARWSDRRQWPWRPRSGSGPNAPI
jgi:site-specific recombinase XerD